MPTDIAGPLCAGTGARAGFGVAAALLLERGPTNESQAAHALSQAIPIGQQLGAGELNLLMAYLYRTFHVN